MSRQFGLALATIVIIAMGAALALAHNFPLTADEGLYISWARLLALGYPPYTEVYATAPPLNPFLLGFVWWVWPSPTALKLGLWLVWGAGVAVAGLIGYELTHDEHVGIVTALLLAFSVQFFAESQAILEHIISYIGGLYGIWLALYYQRTQHRAALIGSGLFIGISLWIKYFLPFLPIILLPIILSAAQTRRQGLQVLGMWAIAGAFIPLLSLGFVNIPAMLHNTVLQRVSAHDAYEGQNVLFSAHFQELLGEYLYRHPTLVVFGLIGLAIAMVKQQRAWGLMASWLAIVFGLLAWHSPLYEKHFILLSPPLALAASYLFALPNHLTGRTKQSLLAVIFIGWFSFGADFARELPTWRALAATPDPPEMQQTAIDFIQANTHPHDCLITDYSQLLYWSDRLPPPELAELSSSRLRSGFLTTPQLQEITNRYNCPIVGALTGRLRRSVPDYVEWVKGAGAYRGVMIYGENRQELNFGRAVSPTFVQTHSQPHQAEFGLHAEAIELKLLGYTPLPSELQPNQAIPLQLFWQLHQIPSAEYTIFVQLRNTQQQTIASADHQPYQGRLPFSQWQVGDILPETTWLQLPPQLPPDTYSLWVGLYNSQTGQRLLLHPDSSGENATLLTAWP